MAQGGGMTLYEIAEIWNDAPAQWRSDVISLMNSTSQGRAQLGWIQNYQELDEGDKQREASKPQSPAMQLATNIGGTAVGAAGAAYAAQAGLDAYGGLAGLGAASTGTAATGAAGAAAGAAAPIGSAGALPSTIYGAGLTAAEVPMGIASQASGLGVAGLPTSAAGATGGAAAGGAGGGGAAAAAGAEGAGAAGTEAAAGIGLGPAAAIAAGLYAGYEGLQNSRDQWQEGHGQQQGAILNATNPLISGANSIVGGPLSNEDTGYLAAMTNPVTTAVGTPLAGYHYLGHELLGLPDVPNFFSGKGEDQLRRDQIRKQMQELGIVDDNFVYGPTGFNIGKLEGKLQNLNGNVGTEGSVYDNGQRNQYDIDFTRGGKTDQEVAGLLAIAQGMGLGGKGGGDFAGLFHNAATASGDSWQNIQDLGNQVGGHDALYGQIHAASESGDLDKGTADAYKNALDELYGVGAYAKGGKAYVDPNKKGLLGLSEAGK